MVGVVGGMAAAAYCAALAGFVTQHAVDRQVRMSDAVSDYGTGPAAPVFVAGGLAGSLGAALLAVAAARHGGLSPLPFMLGALALLRLGVLMWRTDRGRIGGSRESRLHLAFAVVTFALGYQIVSSGTPLILPLAGRLGGALQGLDWIVRLSLIGVVVTLLPALRGLFGWFERAFLLSLLLWSGLVALLLAGIL